MLPVHANLSRCTAPMRGEKVLPLLVVGCLGENAALSAYSKENEDKGQDED